MGRPVNVYGYTMCYTDRDVFEIDASGYRDENGNITWYDGYEPLDDEDHISYVMPCKYREKD